MAMMKRKYRVFLMLESSTEYGRELLRGAVAYARESQNWILEIENRGLFDPIPTQLMHWTWDGILSRALLPATISFLRTLPCPLVEIHGDGRTAFQEVLCDDHQVISEVIRYFMENRMPHLAFYSNLNCFWTESRLIEFKKQIKEFGAVGYTHPGLDTGTYLHPYNLWGRRSEQSLLRWLRKLPRPIGIIAAFEELGVRIINACNKLEIKIPDEIEVLSIGNDPHLCEAVSPSLSSIEINPFRIGYEAARLLDIKIKKLPLPSLPVRVAPNGLKIRESTDIIRTDNVEIIQAIRYIRENATLGITVRDIVEQLHIEQRTLERGIKKILGRTVKSELIRIRMEHAVKLLVRTHLSIREIALNSGFSTQEYFVNAFRRVYLKSPKRYRYDYFH